MERCHQFHFHQYSGVFSARVFAMFLRIIIITFAVVCLAHIAQSARILGLFHMPSYSHFVLGETLLKELAKRGHEVTMISSFPQKTPLENYTDIPLKILPEILNKRKDDRNMFDAVNMPAFVLPFLIGNAGLGFTEAVFQEEQVQALLRSDAKFDLVITEQFINDAHKGFATRFDAPLIVFNTIGACFWANHLVSNPNPLAYASDIFLGYPSRMTFMQRVKNTLFFTLEMLYYHLYFFRKQNELMHKYIPDSPDINDIMYNTSLVFVNSHISFNPPLPHVPSMIEVGGIHLKDSKKGAELPSDLKKFLDGSTDGAIYFSLGSNIRSKDMSAKAKQHIFRAISKLKLNVIWKFEEDPTPDMPKNLKIGKWFPQQSVLAHPNVKLFISHGGLLSAMESVYNGVPLLGIPIFGDQRLNMAVATDLGYAITLNYNELNEDNFYNAINEVLQNPKYAINVKYRQKVFHDNQVKPLDVAVYWTEYVLRHKGAHHLRSEAALELRWYQHILLDVVVFLLGISFLTVTAFCYIIRYVLKKRKSKKMKQQ